MITIARIVCLLATLALLPAAAQNFVPGEVVVGFKPAATPQQIATMEAQLGLAIKSDFPHIRARHYRLPAHLTVENAIPLILQFDFVEYAEPNYLHRRQALPTDPRFGEQWYLRNTGQVVNGLQGVAGEDINWEAARNLFNGTREIIVAVVDTGIALEHPELSGRLWRHPVEYPAGINGIDDDGNGYADDRFGWDFYDNDGTPRDENGHGTLVASLIGAEADNAQGGAGVSPTAKIMALRAGNDFGQLPLTTTMSAFTYAARRGVRIINYSAGGTGFSNALLATIQWLATKGVLLAAAAGNGGSDGRGDDNDVFPTYPAAYAVSNIIAVAATEQDGDLASFSNYGASSVHIAAPGTNILGAAIRTSTHYYENFETGAPGWTQIQLSGSASTLSWGMHTDPQGNHWYADSPGGTGPDIPYQSNTNSALVSPPISLVGVTGAQLSARVWHQLERYYDYGYVELSDDGGATWVYLGSVTGYSFGSCPGCAGAAGTVLRFDLSRYEGRTIRVRFRLDSDSAMNYAGLFVDDVRIVKVEPFQYDGTQYQFLNGTSFSAPLVAGAAALVWSQRPDLTASQVRQVVIGSAKPDARLTGRVASGGKLDAHAALLAAIATPAGLALSAEFVDFGKQPTGGTSALQSITVRNDGATTVSGFSFSVNYSSGSNAFPMGNDCGVLLPGASCTVSVQFAPQQLGEIEGSIRIDSTAPGSPHVFNLLGVGTVAASSVIYQAAGFAPHVDNTVTSYLKDGVPYTTTDFPGTTVFNGYVVKQSLDSEYGSYNYYTNDANGIISYGYYIPSTEVGGVSTSETLVLNPPSKIVDAQFSLGQTFDSSVTATLTWGAIGSFALSYTSSNTPVAFETVTVPAGTFRALRVDQYARIFGPVGPTGYVDSIAQGSQWVVEGLGSVKDVYSISDGSETENHVEVLTASPLLDASPNPFPLPPVVNAGPGTEITSAAITVQGINAGVSISITGGQYSVDGGAWTSASGMVFNGQAVSVRQTASSGYGATTTATLSIGGVSSTFEVTTVSAASFPVTVLVASGGTVTSNPSGISCGSVCTANYTQGTSVTLTATPFPGYTFSGWTGACAGTGACTLTVDAAKDVAASFTQVPDTSPPTIPQELLATAVSESQINLAWSASSDNVGVTAYQVFRGGVFQATVTGATSFGDTGLAATTLYSYTVTACDAAGNCSAPSDPASANTLAAGSASFTPLLRRGWNLLGNGLDVTLNAATVFGTPSAPVTDVTVHVNSIWKWNAALGNWQFYAPSLTAQGNQDYADANGFAVLASIEPGTGYWVNLRNTAPAGGVTLAAQSGALVVYEAPDSIAGTPAKIAGRDLVMGWQLVAIADAQSPSQLNENLSGTPPQPETVKLSLQSLWAWDPALGQWYFYAPQLEQDGVALGQGLALVKQYADNNGFLHFEDFNKKLGVGTGFWMRK